MASKTTCGVGAPEHASNPEFLSLDEAAQAPDGTRRRAQALVEKDQLRALRALGVGGRWLVEAADVYQRRRTVAHRRRPLNA